MLACPPGGGGRPPRAAHGGRGAGNSAGARSAPGVARDRCRARSHQGATLLGSSTGSSHSAYSGARPCSASSNFAGDHLGDLPGRLDRVVVDLAHRHQLGGGAGEEDLVGEVELGARRCRARPPCSRGRGRSGSRERRLIPSRIEAVCGGVRSSPSRTTKMFSPEPSQTMPALVEQDRLVVAGVVRPRSWRGSSSGTARRPWRAGSARRARSAATRRPWRGCRRACPPRRGRRPRARPRSSPRPARFCANRPISP